MAKVLSPQEERIEKNKGQAKLSGREKRIYDSFQNAKSVVDVQRARYFTESFKETEGQALSLRWAKALYTIAKKSRFLLMILSLSLAAGAKAESMESSTLSLMDVFYESL